MSRRSAIVLIGGVIGCSAILLCMFLVSAIGLTTLVNFSNQPVDRIVYVDNNTNIQIVDALGEQHIALTSDASTATRIYDYPTWAFDSQTIAFVGVDTSGEEPESTLYTASPSGAKPISIFKSTIQAPFYLYWAPDSKSIGFLAQTNDELGLMLARADGKESARTIQNGSPFYWGWSPDSQSMVMHIGGSRRDSMDAQLAIVHIANSGKPQPLGKNPGEFLAPQYSPDGSSILFSVMNEMNDTLFLADAQADNPRKLIDYEGRIAFAWSPDGKKIASLITSGDTGLPHYGKISVSDGDGKNYHQVIAEDALAFFWSPNSQRIAYLAVSMGTNGQGCDGCGKKLAAPLGQTSGIRLQWRVVNVADGNASTLITFAPTRAFVELLPYFDQYARSITFWSPDSTKFVYTQNEGRGNGSVWVADATGKSPPRRVGEGTLAVWSWK
jgi:TolB protein